MGLDKPIAAPHDENGKLVAIDRVSQRMEAWLQALDAKADVDAQPGNDSVVRGAVRVAKATGFFSIWMAVFAGNVALIQELLAAYPGTLESGCFDPHTTQPIAPGPNLDALQHGGKS